MKIIIIIIFLFAVNISVTANTLKQNEKSKIIVTNLIENVEPAVTNEFNASNIKTNLMETPLLTPVKKDIQHEQSNVVSQTKNRQEPKVELQMSPEEEYITEMSLPTVKTVEVFAASLNGLKRGGINLVTFPAELVRGFTYEYSAKKWYMALGTSWLSALGGTGARAGAGLADLLTLGVFGNVEYADGFPDYVWQDTWIYKPPRAVPTTDSSNPSIPAGEPEVDIKPNVKTKVKDIHTQENIEFYKKGIPESTF